MVHTSYVCVLLALCFAGTALARQQQHAFHNSKFMPSHHRPAVFDENKEFLELEDELIELNDQLVLRRLEEEFPTITARYDEQCDIDLKTAMCELSNLGQNFAICVGNEAASISTYKRVGAVVDFVLGLATGPLWATVKGVGHLAQGNVLKAGDNLLEAGLTAIGDPTVAVRGIIAESVGNLDPHYMVCATCAMALAWAIANDRIGIPLTGGAGLLSALTHTFKIKPSVLSKLREKVGLDAPSTRQLCPMTSDQMLLVRDAAREGNVNGILAQLAVNQVEAARDNVWQYFKGIGSPFQAAFNQPLIDAEGILKNVINPSTDEITPMGRGGWLVEDLTDDYFSDAQDPVQYFTPKFNYRKCQDVCGGGALDVRGCARECRTCNCSVM